MVSPPGTEGVPPLRGRQVSVWKIPIGPRAEKKKRGEKEARDCKECHKKMV